MRLKGKTYALSVDTVIEILIDIFFMAIKFGHCICKNKSDEEQQ